MRLRRFRCCAAVVAFSIALVAGEPAEKAPKAWNAPRTPDGQPDLQGIWTGATITPLERSKALGAKATLTEEEAQALEKRAADNRVDAAPTSGDVGNYNQAWFDSGTKVVSTRQTSLVIEPSDGRVPLTPLAESKRDYNLAHNSDSYIYMSPWDRCITRGAPAGMFPAGYNNAYQIVQTPGYVLLTAEMIHESRIIPLNTRGHLPPGLRQWNGDSIGHWEGNTLVVETTNYNGKGWIATSAAGGRIKGVPQTADLHVVEKFTRTDPGTILYQVTLDDPNMFSRAWTVQIPLTREENYRIYEYACHEGNEAVELVLRGGRALEAEK